MSDKRLTFLIIWLVASVLAAAWLMTGQIF